MDGDAAGCREASASASAQIQVRFRRPSESGSQSRLKVTHTAISCLCRAPSSRAVLLAASKFDGEPCRLGLGTITGRTGAAIILKVAPADGQPPPNCPNYPQQASENWNSLIGLQSLSSMVQVGNHDGIELEAVGFQFEPNR